MRERPAQAFLAGGGRMGARMRGQDWSLSPLGPPDSWPVPLRTAAGIMLAATQPMFAAWGPARAMLYNDAYSEILGDKDSGALGQPFFDVWQELGDSVGPLMDRVYAGAPVQMDEIELVMLRRGAPEVAHFSFFYAPLLDIPRDGGEGTVGGMFCACVETTAQVLAARRDAFRHALDERLRDLSDPGAVMRAAEAALGEHLGAARVGYAEMEADAAGEKRAVVAFEWNPVGLPTIVGAHRMRDYGPARLATLRAGVTEVVPDFTADPRLAPADVAAHHRLGVRAQVVVPLVKEGRLAALLFVHAEAPRAWGPAEIAVVEDAAERTWAAVERARAEAGARESESRLAQMFEQAPTFMALLDGPEHRFVSANPGYMRLVGHRPLIGRRLADALPDVVEQGYLAILDEVFRTGRAFSADSATYVMQAEPGGPVDERVVDFVLQPLRDAASRVTGIFIEGADVTARARADKALRENEARLRALNTDLERQVQERARERSRTWLVSTDLLTVISADGTFESVNPAWIATLGWPAEAMTGRSYADFVHPDDLAPSREALEVLRGGNPVLRFENRYRHRDGSHRWLSWVAVPEDGHLYCSARDVTEEKARAEALVAAQAALQQSQKMEAIGQLTGGLAHDVNNMLQGIGGALQMMERRIEGGRLADLPRLLKAGREGVDRAAALTHRLLAFARRQRLDTRPVEVDALVQGMADLVRRTVGPSIEVRLHLCGGDWPVRCDPSGLESALLNLAINARDAMPGGGRLTFSTREVNLSAAELGADAEGVAPGDFVLVSVRDTGEGMPASVLARVFEPFFTTKPIGKGTGLGLSQIYGFVRQSGGLVRIDSAPGAGTTVHLHMPRHHGEAEEARAERLPDQPSGRSGTGVTLLLVEDEPAVRALAAETLRDGGYTVLEAPDGLAALALLSGPARLDLLVTDVGLPGLNGRQLADAARERRPTLPVLFITGYAGVALDGGLPPGMAAVPKPFSLDRLTEAVAALLAGGAG